MKVRLRGVHRLRSKGRTYYYAWRGGPRLRGEPGTPEFMASYNEAVAEHRAPDSNRFASVITAYKASPDFQKLADSTRKNWMPWLDRVGKCFGDLRVAQFDRTDKIRPLIRTWRNQWAATPRTADYGLQVLSRVLSYAVESGRIASNPCEGIKHIYTNDRSEIIWTDADLQTILKVNPPAVGFVIELGAHTGLRLGDLLRLTWANIGEDSLLVPTERVADGARRLFQCMTVCAMCWRVFRDARR